MDDLVKGLNKKQYEAVTFNYTKALQVVAGPGTGKTKVLTARFAYLVLNKKLNPLSIIITTFTKKAANEIKERLTPILSRAKIDTRGLFIGTFHSICIRLLQSDGFKIGLPKEWAVFSSSETEPIIKKLIETVPDQIRDYATSYREGKVYLCTKKGDSWILSCKLVGKHISKLKAEAMSVEMYEENPNHDEALLYFYKNYQLELYNQNALDFDDILLFSFKLLSQERCWPHIRHVLVDEFQDTNNIQLELMYLLARGRHESCEGVTVVGDPDQSIYAFRSALARNFEEMINKCPIEYHQVILEENYRSSQNILDASESLICQQTEGRYKRLPLKAQFSNSLKPVLYTFPSKFLEAPTIAREILYIKAIPELFSYDDFAILVRQRRQIINIERALIEHRIPYKIVNTVSFWEKKETRAILDLIKVVCSDVDKYAMLRSLRYPHRGVGDITITKIEYEMDSNINSAAFQTLKNISITSRKDIPAKAINSIKEYVMTIEVVRKMCYDSISNSIIAEVFDRLYESSGLQYEFLYNDGPEDRRKRGLTSQDPNYENIRHLNVMLVKKFLTTFKLNQDDDCVVKVDDVTNEPYIVPKSITQSCSSINMNEKILKDKIDIFRYLRSFVNFVNLYSTPNVTDLGKMTLEEKKDFENRKKDGYVTISTIHGSKGLEWPIVFIPGCVEGTMPCTYSSSIIDLEMKNDEYSDNEISDQNQSNNVASSPVKKIPKVVEGLNEERRMFFVALTRAKFLLYLTTTKSETFDESKDNEIPSSFLSNELKKNLSDTQHLFNDVNAVKNLYKAMKKQIPNEDSLSISRLIEDYQLYADGNHEFMIWKKQRVYQTYNMNITENKIYNDTLNITTAATLLALENKHNVSHLHNPNFSTAKSMNKSSYKKGITIANKQNDSTSSFGQPCQKIQFAPKFANKKIKCSNSIKWAPKSNNGEHFNCKSKSPGVPFTDLSLSENSNKLLVDSGLTKHEVRRQLFISSNKSISKKLPNAVITGEIKLEDLPDSESEYLANQDNNTGFNDNSIDEIEITASDLLHDPSNLKVDNRPVLTNAKILADATKKAVAKKRNLKVSKKDKKKVKGEFSNADILARLQSAKKKTKNKEVIILD